MYKQPPQPPPQHLDFQFHPLPISNSDHQKKQKNNTQVSKRSTKVSGYSTSSNSNYTNSDSVNAQLLRELIRQAGRNNRNATRMDSNSSVDMVNADFRLVPPKDPYYYAPMANGNYHTQPYQQYCTSASSIDLVGPPSLSPASSHSSRYHVPLSYNHISSNKKTVKQQKNHPYQRSSNSKSSNMGKPSMYSSDISQAQLLEIQAISRAQQDFIRAREQQEAEKEMMMKHQKKVAGQPLL
jgi:membrane-associated HD superfamily phosphohydrolase